MSYVDIYFPNKQDVQQNSQQALFIGIKVCQKPVQGSRITSLIFENVFEKDNFREDKLKTYKCSARFKFRK